MEQNKPTQGLPENAMRPLKPGEEYHPLMPAKANPREVTTWSLIWGLLMAVIFSAATAYLGLKVGQVFEAAIPITIIAVGLASATKRKDPLGENVIIQSIGACSGMIVAGAIFTLPPPHRRRCSSRAKVRVRLPNHSSLHQYWVVSTTSSLPHLAHGRRTLRAHSVHLAPRLQPKASSS